MQTGVLICLGASKHFLFSFFMSQMWTLHTATLVLIKSIKCCCDSQGAHRWKSPVVAWWWRCVAFWGWQSHCTLASIFNSMSIKYKYTKALCIDYSPVEHIYFKHFEKKNEGKKKSSNVKLFLPSVWCHSFLNVKLLPSPSIYNHPPDRQMCRTGISYFRFLVQMKDIHRWPGRKRKQTKVGRVKELLEGVHLWREGWSTCRQPNEHRTCDVRNAKMRWPLRDVCHVV